MMFRFEVFLNFFQFVTVVTFYMADNIIPNGGLETNKLGLATQPSWNLTVTGCKVLDWTNMTCFWHPSAHEIQQMAGCKNMTQTFYWKNGLGQTAFNSTNLSATQDTVSYVSSLIKRTFQVTFSCERLNVSASYTFIPPYSVQPGSVRNLKATNVTAWSVELQWKPSRPYLLYGRHKLTYQVNVNISSVSDDGDSFQSLMLNSDEDIVILELNDSCNILPHTKYRISIRYIPLIEGKKTGFWSDPQTIYVETNSTVPAAAPTVRAGSFEDNTPMTTIYWQAINEDMKHGELKSICICYQPYHSRSSKGSSFHIESCQNNTERNCVTVDANMVSADLPLFSNESYVLIVAANTEEGFNTSLDLTPVYIKKKALRPKLPEDFVVRYNKTEDKILCSWSASPEAVSYTIYWCLVSVHTRCTYNELQWIYVPSNVTTLDMANFNLSMEDIHNYRFAVSAEAFEGDDLISSGLKYSYCAHDAEKAIEPPSNIQFEEGQMEEKSLRLTWEYDACASNVAYVQYYEIHYWEEGKSESRKTKIVTPDQRHILLEDLTPGQTYMVHAQSKSPWQKSSEFDVGSMKTTEQNKTSYTAIAVISTVLFVIFSSMGSCLLLRKCNKDKNLHKPIVPDFYPQTHVIDSKKNSTDSTEEASSTHDLIFKSTTHNNHFMDSETGRLSAYAYSKVYA